MAKLKLNPDAVFNHTVKIPVAGHEDAELTLSYKWRGAKDLQSFVEKHKESLGVDAVLDCVQGWDLEDNFNEENVKVLADHYPRAVDVILDAYIREIYGARQGN